MIASCVDEVSCKGDGKSGGKDAGGIDKKKLEEERKRLWEIYKERKKKTEEAVGEGKEVGEEGGTLADINNW